MVKQGATIFVDHWFTVAQEESAKIFDVVEKRPRPGWRELVAPGFGQKGDYGSGSVFAKEEDLVELPSKPTRND